MLEMKTGTLEIGMPIGFEALISGRFVVEQDLLKNLDRFMALCSSSTRACLMAFAVPFIASSP